MIVFLPKAIDLKLIKIYNSARVGTFAQLNLWSLPQYIIVATRSIKMDANLNARPRIF